jgi:conjugal transfer pilus assembly protein TraK
MLSKVLFILIVCTSVAFAADAPQELPFIPVDGGVAIPGTDVFISNKDGGAKQNNGTEEPLNVTPISGQENGKGPSAGQIPKQDVDTSKFGKRMFNEDQDSNGQADAAGDQSEITPTHSEKLKKRPMLLDKEFPLLPASKTKQKTKQQENTDHTKKDKSQELVMQPVNVIMPKPGKVENIAIAKGKLNRIVTPYNDPKVLTVDAVETKIDGSVVYVATESDAPISMFISDTESGGSNAISLQLTPTEMTSAVEVKIEGEGSKSVSLDSGFSKSGTLFKNDTPYISDVKSIMQSMGKQQIPLGFTLEAMTDEVRLMTNCHDNNITFSAGQLLSGNDTRVVVMIAQNIGLKPVIFDESSCAGENVMAVSAWPKVRLEIGEKTEVYILMRLKEGKVGEEIRPALL